MRNIKLTLAIFFGGIFALWLLATSFPDQWGVYPVRNLMLQLTGAISILAMSACLILAEARRDKLDDFLRKMKCCFIS